MKFIIIHENNKAIPIQLMQTCWCFEIRTIPGLTTVWTKGNKKFRTSRNALIDFFLSFATSLLNSLFSNFLPLKIKNSLSIRVGWQLWKLFSGLVRYFWVNNGKFGEMMLMRLLVNWSLWLTKFHQDFLLKVMYWIQQNFTLIISMPKCSLNSLLPLQNFRPPIFTKSMAFYSQTKETTTAHASSTYKQ